MRERGQTLGTEGLEEHIGLYFSEGLAGLHPLAKATMENIVSVSGHKVTLGGPIGVMVITEFRCAAKYMSLNIEFSKCF